MSFKKDKLMALAKQNFTDMPKFEQQTLF